MVDKDTWHDSLNVNHQPIHHFASRYSCPATGPLEYLSDNGNFVIDVYAGKFSGQAPCGVITSGLNGPFGLYVDPATRDLYVANIYGARIMVFHRGETTSYNTYADPARDLTEDVTLAKDGTVISSNCCSQNTYAGSISTWIKGPNGGTFVGTFAMYNFFAAHITIGGDFIAVDQNGTVYYDSFDTNSNLTTGTLSTLKCPTGKCGTQTQVGGVLFLYPSGVAVDASGDVMVLDTLTRTVNTFELPNPAPSTLSVADIGFGLAINPSNHDVFVTDNESKGAAEYAYPSGNLIGTISCASGCIAVGVAVDP